MSELDDDDPPGMGCSIVVLMLGLAIFWYVGNSAGTGTIYWIIRHSSRDRWVFRQSEPGTFWWAALVDSVWGAMCIGVGVLGIRIAHTGKRSWKPTFWATVAIAFISWFAFFLGLIGLGRSCLPQPHG